MLSEWLTDALVRDVGLAAIVLGLVVGILRLRR
jgi:hypothetical protein